MTQELPLIQQWKRKLEKKTNKTPKGCCVNENENKLDASCWTIKWFEWLYCIVSRPHPLSLALFEFHLTFFVLHGQCHNSFCHLMLLSHFFPLPTLTPIYHYQCKWCSEDISVRKCRIVKMILIEIPDDDKKRTAFFQTIVKIMLDSWR